MKNILSALAIITFPGAPILPDLFSCLVYGNEQQRRLLLHGTMTRKIVLPVGVASELCSVL